MAIEILIVEDSPTQAEQLRFLLEENGYAVRVAHHGAEGLAMMRERRPGLVISDVIMPKMDGYELCRAIRADSDLCDIPVVLLTTFASVQNIVRGLECGAHNFLRKPYEPEYLIQRVRVLIEGFHQRRQSLRDPSAIGLPDLNHAVKDGREQILDLLVSTYDQAIRMNAELERQRDALAQWQSRLAAMQQLAVRINDAATTVELIEAASEDLLQFPGVESVIIETVEPRYRAQRGTATTDSHATEGASRRSVAMSFPLQGPGRALGTLLLNVRQQLDPDLNDRALLYDMADRIAVALERLILLESLEERVRERTAALAAEVVERRNSEEQLRLSEERYRLLFERNLAGIVQSSLDGKILNCNPAFARLLEYDSPAQLRGENMNRFWETAGKRGPLIEQLQRDGQVSSLEVDLCGKSGQPRAVLCNLTLTQPQGGDQVIETTLVDLTDYKQLEVQFRQAQKMESLGLLAGGIAHDFNNLLTVISGYNGVLAEALTGDAEMEKPLSGIEFAVTRAAALTRQLLAFSRRQVMKLQLIDLNELIASDAEVFCRLLDRGIELVLKPAECLGAINADRSQVEQVLLNLLVNARDAMPQGGRIVVSTRQADLAAAAIPPNTKAQPGRFAVIDVSDTGCGIKPEIQARIFEPFFSTKGEKGTGLGLSTVHGIIVQSGGFIQVKSSVGEGTTFSIYLPLAVSAAVSQQPAGVPVTPVSGPVNILLVEDDEDIRVMMAEFLQHKGYSVRSSCHPLEALDLCRCRPQDVHVLIADLNLPDMDGPALARAIRAQNPEIRLLFTSGQTGQDVGAALAEFHGLFLAKPYSARQLHQMVQTLINGDDSAARAS